MIKENLQIRGINVWIIIDQIRTYSLDRTVIVTLDECLCYFNFSEPTAIIIGEIFRENGLPKLFNTVGAARTFAIQELENKLR